MRRDPRVRLAGVLLVVAASVLTACGETDDATDRPAASAAPSREELVAAIQEQLGATPEQARCVADYVEEDYGPDGQRILVEDGLSALTQGFWQPYLTAAVACTAEPAAP